MTGYQPIRDQYFLLSRLLVEEAGLVGALIHAGIERFEHDFCTPNTTSHVLFVVLEGERMGLVGGWGGGG